MEKVFEELEPIFFHQVEICIKCAELNMGKSIPAVIQYHEGVCYCILIFALFLAGIGGLQCLCFSSRTDERDEPVSQFLDICLIASACTCLFVAGCTYVAKEELRKLIDNPGEYRFKDFLDD